MSALPTSAAGYRAYLKEYERLEKEYRDEKVSKNEKRAALLAYEMVCLHSRIRDIEKNIETGMSEIDMRAGSDNKIQLSEIKRFIFYRYIKGYGIDEIAELLNVSRSTAYRIASQSEELIG